MRRLAITFAAFVACSALPVAAATKHAKQPKTQPPATATVVETVERSGTLSDTRDLRDLVAFDAHTDAGGWAAYAQRRAELQACHAERYAQAKANVLTGRTAPLRDC